MVDVQPVFRIGPCSEMSKGTGRSPESLERYRDAWELLQLNLPKSENKFEISNWQQRAVKDAAKKAGLDVEFINTKKHRDGRRWPPILTRRLFRIESQSF